MMEPLAVAMALSSANTPAQPGRTSWRLGASLLGSLLVSLLLAGCSAAPSLPRMLFITVGINDDEAIDTETLNDLQQRLALLERDFRSTHPGSHFQFQLVPESRLTKRFRARNEAGLAPDLALVNVDVARRLLAQGDVDPYPITPEQEQLFEPAMLTRLRDAKGRLAALPVMVRTQLACFNRRRLAQPPQNVNELLKLSSQGHAIGISIDPVDLVWSAGSLGALGAIHRAAAGAQPTPAQLQGLKRWLLWLQTANIQQRITFFASQPITLAQFEAGRVDWIACDSFNLPLLSKRLGEDLGVSPLPSGPAGPASPLNHLRVLVLGRSSSASGRQQALAFSRSVITPQSQHTFSLGSQSVLPANRFVSVPVQSSARLAAMVIAAQQGNRNSALEGMIHGNDPRMDQIQTLLNNLVFGELDVSAASQQLIAILRRSR